MAALAIAEVQADPFATIRAVKKMRAAGFSLTVDGGGLVVTPASGLTDSQRAYIRAHKAALVGLLSDADELHAALVEAGPAGLGWREGTPAAWGDARLLAAGEVLYSDGRMVNRHDRRYCFASAPSSEIGPEYPPPAEAPEIAPYAAVAPPSNVTPIDREAYEERAAIMEYDGGLPRDEAEQKALALAIRAAELGKRQGQRTDLQNEGQESLLDELVQNFAQVESGQKTIEVAATKAGFGNKETYRQAKAVVESAEPELVNTAAEGVAP